MRIFWQRSFYFCVCVLAASCSSPQNKSAPELPTQRQQEKLATAKAELHSGSAAKALKNLKQLSIESAQTSVGAESKILLGDHYAQKGQLSESLDSYQSACRSKIHFNQEAEACWKAARVANSLLHWSEVEEFSYALLSGSLAGTITPLQKSQAELWLIGAYLQTQRPMEALDLILKSTQPDSLQAKAIEIVDTRLNDAQLDTVAHSNRFGNLRANAYSRLGFSAYERGDFDRARKNLNDLISLGKDVPNRDRAQELIRQIDARSSVDGNTVGAVLPLTGKNAKVGYKALRGLQLGLGVYGNSPSGIRLAVVDSEENADTARRAVEKLVLDDHVVALVGSLLSKEASAVASKSQELGVPSIALSQKSGVTAVGDYVFRNALTPEMQVHTLLDVAMGKKGMKSFAILYPNDPYGIEYANAFWDEVVLRGGEIHAAQMYDPAETDFRVPIRKLVGTYFIDDRTQEYRQLLKEWQNKQTNKSARNQVPQDLLPPVIDFDAIFIPDSARAVGQIAPMLAYNDIKDVTLLGTNLWNTASLIERAGKFVEGALFVDSSLPVPGTLFAQEFQQVFGVAPDFFEIQSYETGLLLRTLIKSGATTRISLRDSLKKLDNFAGVISPLKFNSLRELMRPVTSYTVQAGAIQSIQ